MQMTFMTAWQAHAFQCLRGTGHGRLLMNRRNLRHRHNKLLNELVAALEAWEPLDLNSRRELHAIERQRPLLVNQLLFSTESRLALVFSRSSPSGGHISADATGRCGCDCSAGHRLTIGRKSTAGGHNKPKVSLLFWQPVAV